MLPKQKPCSKRNNASRERRRQLRAKLYMANGLLKLELLRICTSDLVALLKRHSLGTKASCLRSLEHPTSRIRSPAQGQVFVHDEFHEFWRHRPSDVAKWTPRKPKVCADAQW